MWETVVPVDAPKYRTFASSEMSRFSNPFNKAAANAVKKTIRSEQRAAFAEKAKGIGSAISGKFKKGNEAMEAYDIYEMIMEAYDSLDDMSNASDVEFAAQLEAML